MYKIVSFRYESAIQNNFAPPPPHHRSVHTALDYFSFTARIIYEQCRHFNAVCVPSGHMTLEQRCNYLKLGRYVVSNEISTLFQRQVPAV